MPSPKDFLRSAYFKLPQSWRLRQPYHKVRSFYEMAQWWPRERIEQWQLRRLKEVVARAYRDVPGYRQLYDEAGITPDDLRVIGDIRNFPFTTKMLIRDNLKAFTSLGIAPSRMMYCTTGGSTGIPFGFHLTRQNPRVESAFMDSAWAQTGWKIDDSGVILRGGYKGPASKLFDRSNRSRHAMSVYHLSRDTYPAYRKFLLDHRPSFLHAYPSSAADFSSLVIENDDVGTIRFDQIFIGSENLYAWQNELIARAFPDARVMHWYGHTECAVWAPWCSHSEQFHICPFYGYAELLGTDDAEVEIGATAEIVGTSFWMEATPFIRYRTLDYAKKGAKGCPKCGREFQLMESIDGRLREVVVSSNGRKIAMASINMHDRTFDEVSQFRFIQKLPGQLELQVIPKPEFATGSKGKIHRSIMEKLGDDFTLVVNPVETIGRTASGKFTFLEQHLDVDHADRVAISSASDRIPN
jgi:phenylacetate-CoA ligase